MQYTVMLYTVTEAGTIKNDSAEQIEIQVFVTDPCSLTTIDLTGVVPDLTPSYTVLDSASVLEFDTSKTSDGTDGSAFACPAFEYALTT